MRGLRNTLNYMKQLSLQEIKQIEFDLLKKFDTFCKENHISYFLSNGTLLGAIKYKGFIPWDDDIDVLVPREDYDKLISLFNDDASYKLFAFEKNHCFKFPFAKLCDMKTRKDELNINNGVVLGVDIDIFPLDAWAFDLVKAKSEVRLINKKMHLLELTKLIKPNSLNPVKRRLKGIVMIFLKIIGSKYFIQSIVDKCNLKKQKESPYVGCKSWCIYGFREIIPAEVFSEIIEVEFEGEKFPAPIGYDIYLRSLYGDYENDPPIDKQKTHHTYAAYRI